LLGAIEFDSALMSLGRLAIERGTAYLESGLDDEGYVELWVGKTLYTPFRVVRAVILSVLLRSDALRARVAA